MVEYSLFMDPRFREFSKLKLCRKYIIQFRQYGKTYIMNMVENIDNGRMRIQDLVLFRANSERIFYEKVACSRTKIIYIW